MARYRALAPLYIDNRYVEIGQIIADDGTGDIPIPTSYVPSPACDPLNASAVAKLTAALANAPNASTPTQPSPTCCVLQLWGLRQQFSSVNLPEPSAAWKSLVHP